YGYHGLIKEEKSLGQRFIVDAVLYAPLKEAGQSDKMVHSIDYGMAYDIIKQIVEGDSKNLLEAISEEIASALFHFFPLLKSCTIKVTKPDPPISGSLDSVAVEIFRKRT